MPGELNLFHRAGTVFLLIAFLLFLIYFLLGAGQVSITSEGRPSPWRNALRRSWQIVAFLAVVSYAGLLPAGVEAKGAAIVRSLLGMLEPIARKVPFIGGFF